MSDSLRTFDKQFFFLLIKQFRSINKIVQLGYRGKAVYFDGMTLRLLENQDKDWPSSYKENVEYQDIKGISRFEPRLRFISRALSLIFRYLQPTLGGKDVRVDGFRIRRISDWLSVESAGEYSSDPYLSILQYLSWQCEMKCEFCLHRGDPSGLFSKSSYGWKTSKKEIETRIKYWEPNLNKGIFRKSDYNQFEILTNPIFKEIAQLTRAKTKKTFNLVTSGSNLNEDMINFLDRVKPVFMCISLNCTGPDVRMKVMSDKRPEVAVNSIKSLNDKKIPFMVSFTAWNQIPIQEICNSIRWVDKFGPYLIRVVLDSHTKHSPCFKKDDFLVRWKYILSHIRELRGEVLSPIIFQPVLLEEFFFSNYRKNVSVEGVIRNSPAYRAGIRRNDILLQISGIPAISRPFARDLLKLLAINNVSSFEIQLKRSRKNILSCFLEDNGNISNQYPYVQYSLDRPIFFPFGIVLREGLDPFSVVQIKSIAEDHNARTILFFTSFLVKPFLESFLHELDVFRQSGIELYVEVPTNEYLLGGNIIIGDLLVVEDFVIAAKRWIKKKGRKPDLIILPSTPFTAWRRDLKGDTYLNIERQLKIPVRLLDCRRIDNIN